MISHKDPVWKNPFSHKARRTVAFTCKLSEEASQMLAWLKKSEGKSKTELVEELISAGYQSATRKKA